MGDVEDDKFESLDSKGNEEPLVPQPPPLSSTKSESLPVTRKKKLSETFSTDSESSKLMLEDPGSVSSSVGKNNNTFGCEDRVDSGSGSISKKNRHGESGPTGSYNFKRKFNFRSDSVYSDVTPVCASNVDSGSGNVASAGKIFYYENYL